MWNSIATLPPLDTLVSITQLQLNDNNLAELPPLGAAPLLQLLDVSKNQASYLSTS
jgi:Leucine-rich repeat (LRR) protein